MLFFPVTISHGGHLTHGSKPSFSGQNYSAFYYGVELDGRINYDKVEQIAKIVQPKIIVCGASAYAREIDFKRFREIADSVGDIELEDFKERYRTLADKHEAMIAFYDVELQYNLKEMEGEFFTAVEDLKKLTFIDSEEYLNKALKEGKSILAEGAQGSLLDVDFGTYPFVTSSNTTAAGACTGLGIAPNKVKDVFGIFKAYTTRVGSGPFPTEDFEEAGQTMAKVGNEFGSVTGRARRCGWLDLVALKYAVQVNSIS